MAAAQGSQPPSGGNAKTRTAPAPVGRRARPLGSVSCSVLKRVIENQSHMDYAMQNDQHSAGHDDLADIWNNIAAPKIFIGGSLISLNDTGNPNQAPRRRFNPLKPHRPRIALAETDYQRTLR